MAKFSRRAILKGGLATGILGIGAKISLGNVYKKLKPSINVARTSRRFRNGVVTTCSNCPAECGIIAFSEYDRLAKIEGIHGHPNNSGKICAKGEAGLDMLYDEERILRPLRRVGTRGEGKWKNISWDDAIREITDRLSRLRDKGNPEQFVFESEASMTTELIIKRFMNAFGSPNAINHSKYGNENKIAAQRLTWGEEIEVPDVEHAKYILLFGANPYESHPFFINLAKRIAVARTENFAKLVTLDVRLTQTSGKSDEWYPVMPGTDAAVALAMGNVIMNEGMADTGFIEDYTNVTTKTLAMHLREYTPERAEQMSGISAENIIKLALEFATVQPSVAISGGGITKHKNGVYTERCIMLLNAITGNIDKKGGYCIPRRFTLQEPQPQPPVPRTDSQIVYGSNDAICKHGSRGEVIEAIRSKRQKIDVYMAYEYNPVYSAPDCESMDLLFKDEDAIPFSVVIDSYMTETASLADIILPAATYLERKELFSPPTFSMTPCISISQPVVEIRGESKSLFHIVKEMASKLGKDVGKYFKMSEDNFLQASISHIEKLSELGGIYYLMEAGYWFDEDKQQNPYKSFENSGFSTPSGRFEIRSEHLRVGGYEPMPVFVPLEGFPVQKRDEFVLVPFKTNVHTADRTANSLLLSEIFHNNPLWINAGVAREFDLIDGDKVEISSKIGRLEVEVRITQGIHPHVIALAINCGHWQFGHIAQAKNFKSSDPKTSLVWWEKEGNGTQVNLIIPASMDTVGKGYGWMDTVVRLRKV